MYFFFKQLLSPLKVFSACSIHRNAGSAQGGSENMSRLHFSDGSHWGAAFKLLQNIFSSLFAARSWNWLARKYARHAYLKRKGGRPWYCHPTGGISSLSSRVILGHNVCCKPYEWMNECPSYFWPVNNKVLSLVDISKVNFAEEGTLEDELLFFWLIDLGNLDSLLMITTRIVLEKELCALSVSVT